MLPPVMRGGGTTGGGVGVGLVERDVAAECDFGVLVPLVLPVRGGGTVGGVPRVLVVPPGPLDITRGNGTGGALTPPDAFDVVE